MTPEMLQDALVAEIKNILSDRRYSTPAGELIPINVYSQNIPVEQSDDDVDPIPYIIVRLGGGEDRGTFDSNYVIKLIIIMGIYDDSPTAQGHRHLLNIINKIYERFQVNPCLDNKFVYQGGFKWDIQEDGYYPYYFGAMEISFNIPALRREDKFS